MYMKCEIENLSVGDSVEAGEVSLIKAIRGAWQRFLRDPEMRRDFYVCLQNGFLGRPPIMAEILRDPPAAKGPSDAKL